MRDSIQQNNIDNNESSIQQMHMSSNGVSGWKQSFKAIIDTITESRFILRTITKHSQYQEYESTLKWLLVTRVVLLLISVVLELGISYPLQWLMSYLGEKDAANFFHYFMIYIICSCLAAPVSALDMYCGELLTCKFREATSKCLLYDYHNNFAFYYLLSDETLDNPGQRLETDVDFWTWGAVILTFHFLREFVNFIGWTIVLLHIGAHMVLYVFVIATAISILSVAYFGNKLTHLRYLIQQNKAAFRAGLVRTRDNAEAISWYRAQMFEHKWSFTRLVTLLEDYIAFAKYASILDFVVNLVRYAGSILPVIILAPQYFRGSIKLGIITQSTFAFQQLLLSLTTIVSQMTLISTVQAGATRVSQVIRAMKTVVKKMNEPPIIEYDNLTSRNNIQSTKHKPKNQLSEMIIHVSNDNNEENKVLKGIKFQKINDADSESNNYYLKIENLTVMIPNSNTLLLSNISLEVQPLKPLLIVGPSGAGKSSLMRVFTSLWKFGGGNVSVAKNCMFLPQKPYLPILPQSQNTLENQLLFPTLHYNEHKHRISQLYLQQLLEMLNLSYVLQYPQCQEKDGSTDWSKLLSLGEQQRLAIGRVLIKKPKIVFLDEATSALDEDNQTQMYQLLEDNQITYVSVGHRPNLENFHQNVLYVEGNGNWKYMDVNQYSQIIKNGFAGDQVTMF